MNETKIVIEKMYGFNEWSIPMVFKTKRPHNVIYGLNASGKSSLSKSLTQLLKEEGHKKILAFDDNDFEITFNFDDLEIGLSENKNLTKAERESLKNRLFIFNKHYVKDSFASLDGLEKIEIGINVKERKDLISINLKNIEDYTKDIKAKFNEKLSITKQKDLEKDSKFIGFFTKDESKQLLAIKNILNLEFKKDYTYKAEDLSISSIADNRKLLNLYSEITKEIITELESGIKLEKYKIDSREDLDFYQRTLIYLEYMSDKEKCPICKNERFDCEHTKSEIEQTIKEYFSSEKIKNIKEVIYSIHSNSNLIKEGLSIFDEILNKNYPTEEIRNYLKKVNYLMKYYDDIIFTMLTLDKPIEIVESINERLDRIKDINKDNSGTSSTKFTKIFDKYLMKFFGSDKLRVTAKPFEDISGNKTLGINILVDGKEKDGTSIQRFFDEVLSESQKTKISLAFFISIVIFKNKKNKKILCVFDDPVDSYDSISKHEISRFLYEFIYKRVEFTAENYTVESIILTHNYEFMRIFLNNVRNKEIKNEFNFYCMGKDNLINIDEKNLFVLNGDYNILKNKFKFDKSTQRGGSITLSEFISFIPILRELSSYSEKIIRKSNLELKINSETVSHLNEYLSDNIIHGFSKNISVKDCINKVEKYIDFNISNIGEYDVNKELFDIVKIIIAKYTATFRNSKLNFYEEIIFKNIIAIYIRAYYDDVLIGLMQTHISRYNDSTKQEVQNDNNMISQKITELFKANATKPFADFAKVVEISQKKVLYNDFAHSASIYMTPLIDISIDYLINEYENLN